MASQMKQQEQNDGLTIYFRIIWKKIILLAKEEKIRHIYSTVAHHSQGNIQTMYKKNPYTMRKPTVKRWNIPLFDFHLRSS